MRQIPKIVSYLILLFPVMTYFITGSALAHPTQIDYTAIDAYIESQMKDLHIPGIGLAIVQGDQIETLHGYGKSGRDDLPVTPQMPFMLASVTKSFTALAIMQLVETGQVELDAPVQKYIPWFSVADPVAASQITLRHLLNQNSGFSEGSGRTELMASDLSDTAIEDGVRRLADDVLSSPPGTRFQYSNVNYNILGLVVQTVSGQSYESYLQEHILDPLEMRHTFTSQDLALQDGMVKGHTLWFGIPLPKEVPYNRGGLPSGYIMSSAEDMAHYVIAQLNGGRYRDVSVLSAQGVDTMHQPAVPMSNSEEFYGMGWHIGKIDEKTAVFHNGDDPRFQTHVLMLPEEDLGIVILMNAEGLSLGLAANQISRGVLAVIKDKQPQPYVLPIAGMALPVGSVLVPIFLAVLWIGWMVLRYFRRQKRGLPTRRGAWWYIWVILLPLLVDIALLLLLLAGIPMMWQAPLSMMLGYFPDLFTLLMLGVMGVAGWGVARTILTLRSARLRVN